VSEDGWTALFSIKKALKMAVECKMKSKGKNKTAKEKPANREEGGR